MRIGALALAGLVAFGVIPAAGASGGRSVESGWWNEASVGPVVAPSTTPSGQLQVSNGLSGPLAFSAIRFTLPAGTGPSETVTVRLATAGAMVGTPAVSACPTTSKWQPGDDQAAAGAPGYDCTGSHQASGAVTTGAESWSFPTAWASKGVVSVALVPTSGTTTPFSISYTAPTSESITIAAPIGPPGNPGGVVVGPPVTAPNQVPVPSGPPATVASPAPLGPSGTGVPVNTPAPATAAGPDLGSLPGPSNQAPGPAAVAAPASQPAGGGGLSPKADNRRGARILAFCLLLATGVILFRVAGQPHRPPRSLLGRYASGVPEPAGASVGSGAPGAVRGICRFAKVRDAPPTRI